MNIPEGLRWITTILPGGYMPNGMLHSHFLNEAATAFERMAAQVGEARQGGDSAASSVHEHAVHEVDAPQ